MATIYTQTGSEKAVILGVREAMVYPFSTTEEWTDLRVGFFLSLTTAGASDTHTGLTETLTTTGSPEDRFWLGLKTNNDTFPHLYPGAFAGLTNDQSFADSTPSKLVSSDDQIGTSTTDFWRVSSPLATDGIFDNAISNDPTDDLVGATTDPTGKLEESGDIKQILPVQSYIHFPQNVTNAGGYAVLVLLRYQLTPTDNRIGYRTLTMTQKLERYSTDIAYSNTPTVAEIRAQLQNPPTTMTDSNGPRRIYGELDAVYAYWPFNNSRLRIHALAIEKMG
jgi:hypothetical protein